MHDTSPIFVYICHPTDCITVCACWWCHPILVIMTVGNTEYQRTDDISIDPKCLETKSQETIDFALWSMNCLNVSTSVTMNYYPSSVFSPARCRLHDRSFA